MTWPEARERMNRLANVLAALDVDIGERVAVLAKVSIEYVPLYYAASTASVVPVPLNYRSAPPEWLHAIDDSGRHLSSPMPRIGPRFTRCAGTCRRSVADRGRGPMHHAQVGVPETGVTSRAPPLMSG